MTEPLAHRISLATMQLYRRLADGLSHLIEEGVLHEEFFPDDRKWIVELVIAIAQADPGEAASLDEIRSLGAHLASKRAVQDAADEAALDSDSGSAPVAAAAPTLVHFELAVTSKQAEYLARCLEAGDDYLQGRRDLDALNAGAIAYDVSDSLRAAGVNGSSSWSAGDRLSD